MADEDQSHAATPHKLKEARKRGQVAKSTEMVSAVVLAVAMVFLCWRGYASVSAQFRVDAALLAQSGSARDGLPALRSLLAFALRGTAEILGPLFGALMLAAVVANLMQTGPVLTAHPLKPDLDRLRPGQSLKRVFSGRSLFELGRTLLKSVLVGWIVIQAMKAAARQFYVIGNLSPAAFLRTLLNSMGAAGLKVVMMLFMVGLIDVIYMRRQFAKKMRMSQRDMRKRSRGVRNTRHADVVITNPTHLAVALKYEHGKMASPKIVAKGAGVLAAAMRQIASRNGVPIVQNPLLARKLYRTADIEQHVPEALYADVARIIIWVFAMKQAAARNAAATAAQA